MIIMYTTGLMENYGVNRLYNMRQSTTEDDNLDSLYWDELNIGMKNDGILQSIIRYNINSL